MKLPTHISYVLKKSFLSSLVKIIELHKVPGLEIFSKWISNVFKNPCHLNKWKKSCHLLSRVLWWKEFEFTEVKMQNESVGKSFYSLSFNFQTVSNSLTFRQSIKQSIKSIYLFITFQNLEFWDVTNLPPLKWISSSRFGEARKK